MEDSCPSGGNHRQVLAVQDQVDPAMAEVKQQTLVEFLTQSFDNEPGLRDLSALGSRPSRCIS